MSTPCTIAFFDMDVVRTVHCHYDGYPKGVGAILAKYYIDIEDVRELIARGDVFSIGETVRDTDYLYKHANEQAYSTQTYTDLMLLASVMCDYTYAYMPHTWWCIDNVSDTFTNLKTQMAYPIHCDASIFSQFIALAT